MDTLQILFFLVFAVTTCVGIYILVTKPTVGNPVFVASLCGLFFGYTAVQLWSEGAAMFFTNHSANLTGIQVWWDLVMSVLIAFFFIRPRAQAVGMNMVPWALLVGTTASIGLLAMCARLFWLERQAHTVETKPKAATPAAA